MSCTSLDFSGRRNIATFFLPEEETPYQFEYEQKGRIVTIGDIHGDPNALLNALIEQKILNESGEFIAQDIDLVLLGDYTGKGPDTRGVWDIINHLMIEARKNGSRTHALFGNHDLVVLEENFKRILPKDLDKFEKKYGKRKGGFKRALVSHPYREMMQNWKSMVKVGETLFVHGGIDDFIYDYDPELINQEVHKFVKEQQDYLVKTLRGEEAVKPETPWHLASWVFDSDDPMPNNPLWSRKISHEKMKKKKLKKLMEYLGISQIVVGHTPTDSRQVETIYEGRVIKADTKASVDMGGKISAVELYEDGDVKFVDAIERVSRKRTLRRIREYSSLNFCHYLIGEFIR